MSEEGCEREYNEAVVEEFFTELNLLRTNPAKYADNLVGMRRHFRGLKLNIPGGPGPVETKEGVRAVDDTIRFIRAQAVREPLERFSAGLSFAAEDHALDVAEHGDDVVDDNGTDESTLLDRYERHVVAEEPLAQIVLRNKHATTGKDALITALIDDGNAERTNRLKLVEEEVGVAGLCILPTEGAANTIVVTFAASCTEGPPIPEVVEEKGGPPEDGEPYPLTPFQVAIFKELNDARTGPAAYAEKLLEIREFYHDDNTYEIPGTEGIMTREGVGGLDNAVEFLREKLAVAPLERISEGLSLSALDHAKELGDNGSTGHIGLDGSTPFDRTMRYGKWLKTLGESISYGRRSPREIVMHMIIDDGNFRRGHRRNVFDRNHTCVGLATLRHTSFGLSTVMEFAGDYMELGHEIKFAPPQMTLDQELEKLFETDGEGADGTDLEADYQEENEDASKTCDVPLTPRAIATNTYVQSVKRPNSGVLEQLNTDDPYVYDFSKTMIAKRGLSALLDALALNTTFETLKMPGNGLHNDGIEQLCQLLKGHESVTSLDVRQNQLSFRGGLSLLELVRENKNITALDYSGNPIDCKIPHGIRLAMSNETFDWDTPLSEQIEEALHQNCIGH